MKIKLKMNRGEMIGIITILELLLRYGNHTGIEGWASTEILRKIYLKMVARWGTLKPDNNTLTLSAPEAWAIRHQLKYLSVMLGDYEKNIIMKIDLIIDKTLLKPH